MKKFLLFLVLLIPFIKISALTLCDDTVIPDIPSGVTNYIVGSGFGTYRLFTVESGAVVTYVGTSGNITISSGSRYFIDDNTNQWYYVDGPSSQNFRANGGSFGLTIIATTVDIMNDLTNELQWEAGYNLSCLSPEPEPEPEPEPVPQDFSLINTIASYINNFIENLQESNISIHEIFIGLCIFNLLVFVVCYIATHFE